MKKIFLCLMYSNANQLRIEGAVTGGPAQGVTELITGASIPEPLIQ